MPFVAFWERPLWTGRDNIRDGGEPFWMRPMAQPHFWDANTYRWIPFRPDGNWIEQTNMLTIPTLRHLHNK